MFSSDICFQKSEVLLSLLFLFCINIETLSKRFNGNLHLRHKLEEKHIRFISFCHSLTIKRDSKWPPQKTCRLDTSTVSVVVSTFAEFVGSVLKNPWTGGHFRSSSYESHSIMKHLVKSSHFLFSFVSALLHFRL